MTTTRGQERVEREAGEERGAPAWAARSASTRLRWVIAGLMTLFVGINLVFAIPDLSHPESAGPFIVTAVVVVGGLVTVAQAGDATVVAEDYEYPDQVSVDPTGAIVVD